MNRFQKEKSARKISNLEEIQVADFQCGPARAWTWDLQIMSRKYRFSWYSMICNYIDIQRFIFLWFSQNLIKIPLTEIKCLRIVYADMIFAYLSTFIKPTDYLFSLIHSWNNNQIFVLFALFTHCLRDVYALFTQNLRINGCISMYFDGYLHLHLLFWRHFCWKIAFLR